ncbi:transcription factor bHLH101 [Canna indica]|uniref:Protein IRON-RELATED TRANSCRIPTION FACTOR 2 n=1 Tax=Canna indica TaxID=4628 RepID=A0AAQ3KDE7_9LILI|nr:transcription factor bHLH101 [Canna indica]
MGWQQEETMANDLLYDDDPFACYTPKETDISSYQSLGFSELDLENDLLQPYSIDNLSNSNKKLSHNAYERDRRKKLNDLYSSLRSVLPDSDHSKRKVSIPVTISRVLKYIPELQGRVERLVRRKEEIMSELPSSRPEEQSHCVASATCLSNREVMVQLCLSNQDAMVSLSKALKILEGEGLHLMNASTCTTEDGRCFTSLHLQAREVFKKDNFSQHLIKEIKEKARLESNITSTPSLYMQY